MGVAQRLQHAWNAFFNKDPTEVVTNVDVGPVYSYRPDRMRFSYGNERSIVTSIYNRIAMDAAAIKIEHVRLDEDGRFLSIIKSKLNECLTLSANIDQTNRAFIQDAVQSMLDEGSVALVPVDTDVNPITNSFDVISIRTGKIVAWYPQHVRIEVWNENAGKKEEVTLPKSVVAIVENPLYSVVNEPNSTLKRLIRKLSLLDIVDEQTSSGKLDLIIQLPYIIKTESRQKQAEKRRQDIVDQLTGSKYGIAYTDGTERITQLNRPIENNLLSQIEYLTNLLYSQLGITTDVLNGSASDAAMQNYMSRTIEPIVSAMTLEMSRKFLTKTARTQGQFIMFFQDPFKFIPVTQVASIADTFSRNEILTSNEIRQIIGMRPSKDPNADELRNSNINHPDEGQEEQPAEEGMMPEETAVPEGEAAQPEEPMEPAEHVEEDLETEYVDDVFSYPI